MREGVDVHRFNNDLLANKGDCELAASTYPGLIHVLDHPDLQRLFAAYDAPANVAKKRSRRAGLLAIFLGTVALLGASLGSLLENAGTFSSVVGVVAAGAGILGVAIGLWGVLYGPAKRNWLYARLMTERLRQFHFQIFVLHLPEVLASLASPATAESYAKLRERWFDAFRARYEGHLADELTGILEGRRSADVWLHVRTQLSTDVVEADLRDVFASYSTLRIRHQLQYANYKLRSEGGLFSASPRKLGWLLSQAALTCVLLLFAIHVAIALGLSVPVLNNTGIAENPYVHVVAIWCAILALAIRAVSEGLGLGDETERYRDYRSTVEAIRERFDEATEPDEKIRSMEDMERLTYEEMCSFLRTASDTRFVL